MLKTKTSDKIKRALKMIAKEVDTEDRIEAAKALGVHQFTIDRYLRGDARKEAFGINLLKFLKGRLKERESLLDELTKEK